MSSTGVAMEKKSVMLVAIDEHSYHALEWTLEHFFSSPETSFFKLIVVHALPPPMTTFAFSGPILVIPMQQGDFSKAGAKVMEKAKEICQSKSVDDVMGDVMQGDGRNVLCEAVEKYHASVFVVI